MHFKAVEAHLKQNGSLPVNMKFLIEGEEEVGSANLDNFIQRPQGPAEGRRRRHLATRRCSIAACRRSATACAAWPTSRSTCAAARPTCIPDRSAARSRIPAMVLAQMLAQMKDKSGRIKIPGFYDDVRGAAGGGARRSGRSCRSTRRSTRQDLGAPKLFGETGYTTLERIVGAADLRSERPAVRIHRRRRQDRAAGRGDGEGQHAAGAEPGSEEDRRPVRGVREEGRRRRPSS